MTFEEIDREIRLCYGAHQAFLRLGFDAEHIFCGVNFGRIVVVLRKPDRPEFVLTACESPMALGTFADKWNAFIRAMQVERSIDEDVREQMFDEFRGQFSGVGLVTGLMGKGLLPI